MERRQVQQESVAQFILEHLFYVGSVNHKEITLIFDRSRNKQTIWKALRELELHKLVEVKKGRGREGRKVYLSNAGLTMLQNIDDYYLLYEYLKMAHWNVRDNKSEKESQIKTMMVGTDILCYPRYKPDLLTAARIINTMIVPEDNDITPGYWYSESIQEFSEKFGIGIYYSPAEVRAALKKDIGAEQIYRSRFNGIILTPDRLYILYHVNEGLIKINKPSEMTLIQSLQTLFADYTPYTIQGFPSCITFGSVSVDIGIPTLVTGFKGGMIKNPESLNNINAQEAMNFLKANVKLYSEIFYVPVSETGIEILDNIISTTKEERIEEIKNWFTSSTDYICQDNTYSGICISKNCIVEYLTYAELKKILEIRKGPVPVRIVTIPTLAPGIAQAVGPKAIDFVDLDGNEIITNKYDIYGFRIGQKIEESDASKEIKEAITKAVYCRIPLQLHYLLTKDAETENISIQKKIIQIVDDYYSR